VSVALLVFTLQDADFEVQGLVEHKEYLFRVAAANANGAGDWLEMPSPIVAKMPFGESLLFTRTCSCHRFRI